MKRLLLTGLLLAVLPAVGCAEGFAQGKAHYDAQRFDEALRILMPLAESGDAKAQSYVGMMYSKGEGLAEDYDRAAEWFRKSAEKGYGRGQFNLAVSYLRGEGVPQDFQQAYVWFILAERQQIEKAAEGLVRCDEMLTEEQIEEAHRLADAWEPKI